VCSAPSLGGASVDDGTVCLLFDDRKTPLEIEGVGTALGPTSLLLSDDAERGSVALLFATPPGSPVERRFAAHMYPSDNWRVSLHGSFVMSGTKYGPVDFRIQQSWRTNPPEGMPGGSDGGWQLLVFADRRGTRVRPASPDHDTEALFAPQRALPDMSGYRGDLFSDDSSDTAGGSANVTMLGQLSPSAHLDGAMAPTGQWLGDGTGTCAAIYLPATPDTPSSYRSAIRRALRDAHRDQCGWAALLPDLVTSLTSRTPPTNN
jgi:hypothetical protein